MLEQYDDILTIHDLSELLKVGSTQAYRIVRSGKIKAYKEGKDWKIPKQSVSNISMHRVIFLSDFLIITMLLQNNRM